MVDNCQQNFPRLWWPRCSIQQHQMYCHIHQPGLCRNMITHKDVAIMQRWRKTSARDDGNREPQQLSNESRRPCNSAKQLIYLARITDERPYTRQFELKLRRQYHMCLQQNSQISSTTARRDRISWYGRLADFSSDDLFDGQRIEGHDHCSNFTKYSLHSLPMSHSRGGKMSNWLPKH